MEDKVDALEEAAKNQLKILRWEDNGCAEPSDIKRAFKAGAEWQKTQQSISVSEIELRKLAGEAWEKENRFHPNGINPTPFEFGFKCGFKTAQSKKYSLEDMRTAFKLLERAYQFNKQDMGWDSDYEEFKEYINNILKK